MSAHAQICIRQVDIQIKIVSELHAAELSNSLRTASVTWNIDQDQTMMAVIATAEELQESLAFIGGNGDTAIHGPASGNGTVSNPLRTPGSLFLQDEFQ